MQVETEKLRKAAMDAQQVAPGPWECGVYQSGSVTVLFAKTPHENRHGPHWFGASVTHYNIAEAGVTEEQADREKAIVGIYLREVSPEVVLTLLSERDAATARAESAEAVADQAVGRLEDLLAEGATLTAERDALRDEWEEIAAGITTEQPEVGALWPMVSEVSGNLAAARNLFRNEVVAHNRTKAERDRMREALEKAAIAAEVESSGHAIAIIEAALTSAKEPSA